METFLTSREVQRLGTHSGPNFADFTTVYVVEIEDL
jgi:hypothetical protein